MFETSDLVDALGLGGLALVIFVWGMVGGAWLMRRSLRRFG